MTGVSAYIAPYALDSVLAIECREGLSLIEMDSWWFELGLDYGVMLMAGNDNQASACGLMPQHSHL